MKKVLIVFGTRPEAIKMCPFVIELKKRKEFFNTKVCVSGQHREMLHSVLNVFNVVPDYDLNIMKPNQDLFDITTEILSKLKIILDEFTPEVVVVHGDTTTSFAASLAAFYKGIPVAHIEAGLRSDNILEPFPEEYNRKAISIIANYNFAPTEKAKLNLLREGKDKGHIYVTGNTVIDALNYTLQDDYCHPELEWVSDSIFVLLTVHRRENIGKPMSDIFLAIRKIVDDNLNVKVIYPIHLNSIIRHDAYKILSGHERIHIIEPLDVTDFHNFLKNCAFVVTDSGGIQEEASYLGKQVLVLRNTTERPEGMDYGTIQLIGSNYFSVLNNINKHLAKQAKKNISPIKCPFGDGHACEYIADILEKV